MRAAILFVLLGGGMAAQEAAIEGTAVNSVTGERMSGVHVTLFSSASNGVDRAFGAMTDKAGHFSIAPIPAGNYGVMAQRAGFVWLRRKEEPKTASLKAGEKVSDFRIAMAAEAVIRGRVVDEVGDPIPGVTLQTQAVSNDSAPDAMRIGGVYLYSDERGEFRIVGPPGKFYVTASGGDYRSPQVISGGIARGVTYYPGVADRARAVVVEAVAGQETPGIEIRMGATASFAVSGVVSGGPPAKPGTMPPIVYAVGQDGRRAVAVLEPSGGFRFAGLAPGVYRFYAEGTDGENKWRSRVIERQVDGGDLRDVRFPMDPVGFLTGLVEGGSKGARVSVILEPVAPTGIESGASGLTDEASEFRMAAPMAGKYRVRVDPLPDDGYLKLRMDDRALEGDVIEVAGNGDRLRVTIARNAGRVSGKVLDPDGKPMGPATAMIFAIPPGGEADAWIWVRPEADGRYNLSHLRPGEYKLYAVDMLRSRASSVQELLKKSSASADVIDVKEGDRLVRDLKALTTESADAKPKQ